MLVKIGGIPSHLRRYLLMVLSKPSTVETAISYSIRGQVSLGNNPCWNNHALNFPGSD
ncbi:hypothetical protein DPMN_067916 [Dreissena polymorpha]|uniref:Uncharacterized protein n=1 Tax=Dreissena polymorpha TaxID=45954 RepID=A0A9D3Z1J5_DREPO|nr:hypothetical protein DPMN_067916 [Dreissena polymorpha]